MPGFRRLTKHLTCDHCGDVIADVVYRPWAARLSVTSLDGQPLVPVSSGLQLRVAKQQLAAADPAGQAESERRLRFIERNLGELIYDLSCRQGHATLATAPQITSAVRRAQGRWVSLG